MAFCLSKDTLARVIGFRQKFYPIVDAMNDTQVHLFSASDVHQSNEFLRELAKKGKLTFHEVGLADFLMKGQDEGRLRLGRRPAEIGTGRRLTIKDTLHEIPRELWNLVGCAT